MAGPGIELEKRREMAEKCRSCGTCRSVCPIFDEVGNECGTARGKVSLVRAVLDGDLEISAIFDDRIQLCLNCKACIDACPNDVRVDDLVLAARSGLVEAGRLPFLKRLIFRQLLRRGRLLPPVGRLASFFQRFVLRGLPKESAFRALLPAAGIDRDRTFPDFAPRSFIETTPEMLRPAGPLADVSGGSGGASGGDAEPGADERARIAREAGRVAYFVGCATNLLYPETGRAVADALRRSGVTVVVPKGQVCCGTPVFNAGDFVTARELARKNIEVLEDANVDAVITACASGGLALKREYEELLGIEGGVGIPVFDVTEFLALRGAFSAAVGASATGRTLRVTYHDPCHLARGQGVRDEPRAILRSLPGVEFVEMREADRCCGGAGTFSLTHYDVAKSIGEKKMAAVRDAHVDVVVTVCPSCVMQLRDMTAQHGVDVQVMHLADLVAAVREGRGW